MDADGVGGGRRGALLSPGWEDVYMDANGEARCCRLVEGMCIWMRMVLGVDGEARCCRLVEEMCIWMWMVLGWTARRFCCCLVEDFFYFLLAAGWGLHV